MASEARLVQGYAHMVDHTPVAAIEAGKVVTIGATLFITHRNIEAGQLGAVAVGNGQCVYEFPVGAGATTDGNIAYWDDTLKQATATVGTNKKLGIFSGSTAAAGTCRVIHDTSV